MITYKAQGEGNSRDKNLVRYWEISPIVNKSPSSRRLSIPKLPSRVSKKRMIVRESQHRLAAEFPNPWSSRLDKSTIIICLLDRYPYLTLINLLCTFHAGLQGTTLQYTPVCLLLSNLSLSLSVSHTLLYLQRPPEFHLYQHYLRGENNFRKYCTDRKEFVENVWRPQLCAYISPLNTIKHHLACFATFSPVDPMPDFPGGGHLSMQLQIRDEKSGSSLPISDAGFALFSYLNALSLWASLSLSLFLRKDCRILSQEIPNLRSWWLIYWPKIRPQLGSPPEENSPSRLAWWCGSPRVFRIVVNLIIYYCTI